MLLVDEESALRERVEEVRGQIETDLGMEIRILDSHGKQNIINLKAERPEDAYREGAKGATPMAMFYTSGTTGMPKGVPFLTERAWGGAVSVGYYSCSISLGLKSDWFPETNRV